MTALLLQAGYSQDAVAALLSDLIAQRVERETHGFKFSVPHSLSSEAVGVVFVIAAAVIFLLGLLKLIEIVSAVLRYLGA